MDESVPYLPDMFGSTQCNPTFIINLSFQKRVGRDIYETRASLLRKHQPQVDGTPLWHMKKFEKVMSYGHLICHLSPL